ncbi:MULTISPECIES: ribonuclease P protein component [unclassified Acinetobacter]|uniref:ribonuclease P protein component n=1 Tax=unclassified Acinetobacter TaxID=196816 RepID=UPI0035BB7307
MPLYPFGKDARLRCAKDYQGVFNHTLFKVHQPCFLVLATTRTQGQSRLGLVVAKKKVKRAHERNRVKRLSRESFRLHQHAIHALDIVIMPKVGIEQVSNADIAQQLQATWQKLQRLLYKHQTGELSAPPSSARSARHKGNKSKSS